MAVAVAARPADGDVNPLTVALHRDGDPLHQQPDDALPVGRRRARRLPQRRQVSRQRADLLTLRRSQPRRLAAAEARVPLLLPPLLLQRLFPTPLQLAGHQPVLRLNGVVLPPRALRLVTRALQLLLPQP